MTTPEQAIAAARALEANANAWAHEFVLLEESEDFDDYERQELFSEEYERYEGVFDEWLAKLTPHLGAPTYLGNPEANDDLPGAEGWKVAAWQGQEPQLYLSVWHADRELPIVVFLGRLPSEE
jgi:hypothetical protein